MIYKFFIHKKTNGNKISNIFDEEVVNNIILNDINSSSITTKLEFIDNKTNVKNQKNRYTNKQKMKFNNKNQLKILLNHCLFKFID